MKTNIAVLLIAIMTASYARAIEPVTKIIEQSRAPLKITSYTAAYQEGEGIRHYAEYKNTSEKNIVALAIGFVSYDIWNEHINGINGYSIEDIPPDGNGYEVWLDPADGGLKFATGIACISKVRFSDGTVWEVDIYALWPKIGLILKELKLKNSGYPFEKTLN